MKHPRLVAGLWFAAAGALLPALWFLPSAMHRHWTLWFLYLALPGIAAGISGSLLGHRILDARWRGGGWRAALRGTLVALVAFAIFAPCFAAVYALTELPEAHVNVFGLAMAVLGVGLLMTGVMTLPLGGLCGWLLYLVVRRRGG